MNDSRDFCLQFTVRDYECDMQGIVNNAVYQNYLEHARHEYLKSRGLDFAALTAQGIDVMVIRAELDYRRALRSADQFEVSVGVERQSRLRLRFRQRIIRQPDAQLILDAVFICAAVGGDGRPFFPAQLAVLLEEDS